MIYVFSPDRSKAVAAAIPACMRLGISHRGRLANGLADCLGLMLAAHELGGLRYDRRPFDVPYGLKWYRSNPSKLLDGLVSLGWRKIGAGVRQMDVLLAAAVSPVGDHPLVYMGKGQFLHAWRGGVSLVDVDSDDGRKWLDRVTVALRPKER